MTLITPEYLALQRDLHARYEYGRGVDAEDCLRILRQLLPKGSRVLDYGCGRGVFGDLAAPHFAVSEYDPAIPGKDQPPTEGGFDAVVCADVLEHIEHDCLDDVLAHVRSLMAGVGVLIIATQPSNKIMADGRQAHILLHDEPWWREKLHASGFTIMESEDRSEKGKGLVYLVKAAQPVVDDADVVWSEIGEVRTIMAVPEDVRMDHTAENCRRITKRLTKPGGITLAPHDRIAVLVCYGPSLRTTFPHIFLDSGPDRDVISVSAAHAFLIERDIIPMAHIECDPRSHKAAQLGAPHRDVQYWLASCVHPDMVDKVEGFDVSLWHAYNGETTRRHIAELEPDQRVVVGGGSVGLRALSLLYYLGYRRFDIHGMDFSFDGPDQHAGPHAGKLMETIPVLVGGRVFSTSPALVSYFRQFCKQREAMFDAEFRLFGDGLLQHAMRGSS
jgi:hypothetical protein